MKLFAPHRVTFPDPEKSLEGLVDISDDLSCDRLLEAYSFGIFPWPQGEGNLPTLWFCPENRGVLDFSDFHPSASLKKLSRQGKFEFSFNRAFDHVIELCSQMPRPEQSGTWITPRLITAYKKFHRAGYAHSVEVWSGGKLAGGLYGVWAAGSFSGESMFFLKPNASKLALLELVEILRANGVEWMDIQMVTPLSESFGGKYIKRPEFLKRLAASKAKAKPLVWPKL